MHNDFKNGWCENTYYTYLVGGRTLKLSICDLS